MGTFQQTSDPDKVTLESRVGAVDEAAWTSGSGSMIAILKAIAGLEGGAGSMTIGGPLGRQSDATSVSAALSTEDAALLTALLTTSAFQARIPVNGQAAMANSVPTVLASDQSAIPVKAASGTWTDRSTTITIGGTQQTLAASNSTRKAYFIQNIGSGDLWVSLIGNAVADTAGSIKLSSGATLFSSGSFVSTQTISIIGATTGQKFTAYEA